MRIFVKLDFWENSLWIILCRLLSTGKEAFLALVIHGYCVNKSLASSLTEKWGICAVAVALLSFRASYMTQYWKSVLMSCMKIIRILHNHYHNYAPVGLFHRIWDALWSLWLRITTWNALFGSQRLCCLHIQHIAQLFHCHNWISCFKRCFQYDYNELWLVTCRALLNN